MSARGGRREADRPGMTLTYCTCCQVLAADPEQGGSRLCLLCVVHRCDGPPAACEVPEETLRLVLSWESEARPAPPAYGCPQPPDDHPLDTAYDTYVITHYSTQSYTALAAAVGETYQQLQIRVRRLIRAGRLDPSTRYYQPPWSEHEEEYLRGHWGKLTDAGIARHLGRSVTGCRLKAKRLGLTRKGDIYTARAVARIFALDDHCITRWIRLGWLVGKKSAVRCGVNRVWTIEEAALKAFLAAHPEAYDHARIDPEAHRYWRRLADRAAARAHLPARPRRFNTKWTNAEDRYLNDHWGQVPDATIAARVGRTIGACYHRAEDLSITRRDSLTGWFTTTQAAASLGVPVNRVARWLTLGLLPATRSTIGSGNGLLWRISPPKLAAFAHAHPELVHPEQYLNASQVARRLGVSHAVVVGWITAGQLAAVKSLTGKSSGPGARWVIAPAALAAFCATHPEHIPAQEIAA